MPPPIRRHMIIIIVIAKPDNPPLRETGASRVSETGGAA